MITRSVIMVHAPMVRAKRGYAVSWTRSLQETLETPRLVAAHRRCLLCKFERVPIYLRVYSKVHYNQRKIKKKNT